MGYKLFNRTPKGIRPTAEADLLYKYIVSKDTKRYKEYIINKNNEIISRTLEMIDKDK